MVISIITVNVSHNLNLSPMEKSMSFERWKEVDFGINLPHEKYEVSNMGRIKSFAINKSHGKILKGGLVNGYRSISVKFGEDMIRQFYLHRIVAEHFLDKTSPDQHYVIHIDYNKENNSVFNLKWATEKDVVNHNNKNPEVLLKRTTGYKLTESDVRVIKRLLKSHKTRLSIIAKRFGITHTQLNRIRSGENWGHVTIE